MTMTQHPLLTQVGALASIAAFQAGQEQYQQTADPAAGQSSQPAASNAAPPGGGPAGPTDWQGILSSLIPGGGGNPWASQTPGGLPGGGLQPGAGTSPGGALPEQQPVIYTPGGQPYVGPPVGPSAQQVTCADGSVHPAGYTCAPPESFWDKYKWWLLLGGALLAGGLYWWWKSGSEGGSVPSASSEEIARFHRAYSW